MTHICCKYRETISGAERYGPWCSVQEQQAASTSQKEAKSQPAQAVLKGGSLALAACTVRVSPSLIRLPCLPSPLQGNFSSLGMHLNNKPVVFHGGLQFPRGLADIRCPFPPCPCYSSGHREQLPYSS